MSFLSRLKSMIRYSRLWPPPRHHDVSSPWLLRPPERCSFSVSGAYGSFVVISSNVSAVLPRTPGDVGLYLRIAISLRPLQELGQLLAFPERHVRLLRVRAAADELALPLELAMRQRRAHGGDLRPEQRLDGALDVDLVRVPRHLEHQRVPLLAEDRGLLGDQWTPDDVSQFHDGYPSTSWSFSSAARVRITRRVFMTSRALMRLLGRIFTPSRLRTESDSLSSGFTSTSSALPSTPSVRSIAAAALVLISPTLSASTTITAPSFSFCVR